MLSIKVSQKTKERIEKTQARLLLDRNEKVSQSELLEKIVEKATSDPEFIENLFPTTFTLPRPPRREVEVEIVTRKKPDIRLFPDEWTD